MTNTRINRALLVAVIFGMLWSFVGVERIVGDHEVGVAWQAFIKHRPSAKLVFQNPAQNGLEIMRYEALAPADQTSFINYCGVRFGTVDPVQCHTILIQRVI